MSGNATDEYYKAVRRQEKELIREIHAGGHPAQPRGIFRTNEDGDQEATIDHLVLISKFNRLHRATAGAVCLAHLRLAAEALVNDTHRLANASEIEGYKRLQADNLRARHIEDAKYRQQSGTFEVTLPPPAGKQAA